MRVAPRLLALFLPMLAFSGTACGHDAAPGAPPVTPASPSTAAAPASSSAAGAPASSAVTPAAGSSSATAPDAAPGSREKAGQDAVQAWLALVDAGSYGQSWTQAASLFRAAVTQSGWEQAVGGVRTPLGKVLSRSLKSARYATSLPGAPDGEYVVVQFDTSFEHRRTAIETVTPMKDTDGQWHVSGYFIK